MHALCLEFLTVAELSAPDMVSMAAAHGCNKVSLLVQPMAPYQDYDLIGDTPARRETRRRCETLGVTVDMIEAFNIHADTAPKSFRPAMESGAWLGNRIVNLLPRDEDENRVADRFLRTCELADEFGFDIVAELSRRVTLKTIPQAIAFFQRIGRPDVRVMLDSLHFFRAGGDIADIRANRDWIGRIQLSDGPLDMPVADQLNEARKRRLMPGEGALPLRELLAALPDNITIGVEVPDPNLSHDERVRRVLAATRLLLDAKAAV